jgi:hypothetical protein
MAARYYVRLCGDEDSGDSDDLFVPLVRDPQVYRRVQTCMVHETQFVDLSDGRALMGTLLDGRTATVGDLRQGRARDIAFRTWSGIWTSSDDFPTYWNPLSETPCGYLLYVIYAETGTNITVSETRVSVREHADRIRESLVS